MVAWFKNPLFEQVAFEVESKHSLPESLNLLSQHVHRETIFAQMHDTAIGSVGPRRVVVSRHRPFVRNTSRPYFIGALKEEGSRVVLRGIYRMHRFESYFMTVWLVIGLLVGIVFAVSWAPRANEWWFPYIGFGMLAFGFVMVFLGRLTWRGDIEWLSNHLKSVLQ